MILVVPSDANREETNQQNDRAGRDPKDIRAEADVRNSDHTPEDQSGADGPKKAEDQIRVLPSSRHDHNPNDALVSFTKLLSYATILLAAATIFVAYDTHRLANQAVSQSEDNAAALRTAKQAADAATVTATSTRAWLCTIGSSDFSASEFKQFGIAQGPVTGKYINLTNSGLSPAVNIKGRYDYKILNRGDPIPSFPTSTVSEGEGSSIVGPNGSVMIGPFPLKIEDLPAYLSGEKKFILWFSASYRDIFHKESTHIITAVFQIYFMGMMADQHSPLMAISPIGPPAECD